MTDLQTWVAPTLSGLADLLESSPDVWDAPTLCAGWQARHLVAHVTMPARLTPDQYADELAAAQGDFGVLSDSVAARDAALPASALLEQLRSPSLHSWQPPGGGAAGALSHAVIHSLDVTVAGGLPPTAPDEAVAGVLELLVASGGTWFGVDPAGAQLDGTDSAERIALLSGRALPDGRALPRR